MVIASFNLQAFHPKAEYCLLMLAGLLTYSLFTAFPSFGDSGLEDEQFTELTATGIVPELHRTSLLIPITRKPNRLQI